MLTQSFYQHDFIVSRAWFIEYMLFLRNAVINHLYQIKLFWNHVMVYMDAITYQQSNLNKNLANLS